MAYWIFGAGLIGKKTYENISNAEIVGFIDNDKNKIGNIYCGLRVYALEDALSIIANNFCENIIIIANSFLYEIQKQLEEAGVKNYIGYDEIPNKHEIQKNYSDLLSAKIDKVYYTLQNSSAIKEEKSIYSVILAGYNIDDMNVGCRATSEALRNHLDMEVSVKGVIYRYELLDVFDDVKEGETIIEYIASAYCYRQKQISMFAKRINSADAIVINGEGSFIYTRKPRKDLYDFCLLMYICIKLKKPFFLVNAMVSAGNNGIIDEVQFKQSLEFMKCAEKVCLRDPQSVRLMNRQLENVRYVPDALFCKYNFFEHIRKCAVFSTNRIKEKLGVSLNTEYIVLSGNSEAAYHQVRAIVAYRILIQELILFLGEQDDMQMVILESCPGDWMLSELAKEFSLPFVPVETSVTLIGAILQNAQCFISGRYHPSILASLGGTPCVYLGSNSHKTQSLQEVLEADIMEYPAIPNEIECKEIVKEVKHVLEQTDRNLIKKIAKQKSKKAECLAKILFREDENDDY